MAIDISGLPGKITNDALDTAKSTANNATQADANTSNPKTITDAVTITNQASKLKALEDSVSTQSVVDSERVEQLKSAIDSGDYKVDPQRVAEKFLQFESNLVA
jgi:negative regulator of flagellin synthesis FlgM